MTDKRSARKIDFIRNLKKKYQPKGNNYIIGAIIGDIAGSRFEKFNLRSKDFEIFHKNSHPTDDSVMSLAIAKAICDCNGNYEDLSSRAVTCMQELGRKYRNAGYGRLFARWILSDHPEPYGSYGNGAAMRVSPCGFAAESTDEAKTLSAMVTRVTHNHPEGMKGAEAIAMSVVLARAGMKKQELRDFIKENYYDLNFTIDDIRSLYSFDTSCKGSVPVALEAFLESSGFEDAIRTAVSVGGDSDTIACMAGAVAEAYYGVPVSFVQKAIGYLDSFEMEILYRFEKAFPSRAVDDNGREFNIYSVILNEADTTVPQGAEVYTGEEPPEPEGYKKIVDFSGRLNAQDGSSPNSQAFLWVKESDLIPDFSSFDGKRGRRRRERPVQIGKDSSPHRESSSESRSNDHTIVQLSYSSIKVLIPDGYTFLHHDNPLLDAANSEQAYRKTVGNSDNILVISKTTSDEAMNPGNVEGLIRGIHDILNDRQGLIEVKNGETARGYRYIYSIVKTLSEEPGGGVIYTVRADLFSGHDMVEVHGEFTEIGTTGMREAICTELAQRAGLCNINDEEDRKNWSADPYDPGYTKGCLKNLAEKEGLDAIFPDSPLSQAHELLLAVLKDELVPDPSAFKIEIPEGDSDHQIRLLFVDENLRETCQSGEVKSSAGKGRYHDEKLEEIAEENRVIVRQNYYMLDGRKVSFSHSLREHQAVEVIAPENISDALNPVRTNRSKNTKITVINADSFQPDTDLVMNFANAYHPGGGYLHGAPAQEEALCRESTLYASISSKQAGVMYESNRKSRYPFGTDYMLLSPCVEVFRDSDCRLLSSPRTTAVLTIAAPNVAYDDRLKGIPRSDIDYYMLVRLHQFFAVCAEKGYRSLTLGAWGCGAFGHKPEAVAEYFRKVLFDYDMKRYFDRIVFAVKTGSDTHNFDVFADVFRQQ